MVFGTHRAHFVAHTFIALTLLGCSQSGSTPASARSSCEAKRDWKQSKACTRCRAVATEPRCNCPDISEKYKSACRIEAVQLETVASCSSDARIELISCKTACGGDCDCEARCDDEAPSCAAADAELEQCLVQTCDEMCR